MPQPFDILCVGETMVMVTTNDGGRLGLESTFILRPGGAESNVASLVSALGHTSTWASWLGADPFGDMILQALGDAAVDVSFVRRVPEFRTGVYFKDPHPLGTSVHYYRSDSAASHMSPATVIEWADIRPRLLHLSGITSALSASCRDLMRTLVHDRPVADTIITFDVNYRAGLWATADAGPELLNLAQASHVVFVGRDEAEALWGTRTAEDVRALPNKPTHLIVKDGALEAVAFHGQTVGGQMMDDQTARDRVSRVAAPRVDVVEAVGAGDAFAAGWLSAFLNDGHAIERLRLGHLVASRVLESPTDSAELPSEAEIASLLQIDTDQWCDRVQNEKGDEYAIG